MNSFHYPILCFISLVASHVTDTSTFAVADSLPFTSPAIIIMDGI